VQNKFHAVYQEIESKRLGNEQHVVANGIRFPAVHSFFTNNVDAEITFTDDRKAPAAAR